MSRPGCRTRFRIALELTSTVNINPIEHRKYYQHCFERWRKHRNAIPEEGIATSVAQTPIYVADQVRINPPYLVAMALPRNQKLCIKAYITLLAWRLKGIEQIRIANRVAKLPVRL